MEGHEASHSSGLAEELGRAHLVISRALEHAAWFMQRLVPAERPAFRIYLQCLATTLSAHHDVEEALIFPAFKRCAPDAPFDVLDAQHREMDALVRELDLAVSRWASPAEVSEALARLRWAWSPHAQMEEHFVIGPAADCALPAAELEGLERKARRRAAARARPAELLVPFTLYHLRPDERRLPSWFVRTVALPWLWRSAWDPIRPFLPYAP